MAKGSAAVRLGLASGGGMSVTTCGGGEAAGAGAADGGVASRVGVCGLCSGRGTTEVDFAMSDCGVTAAKGTAAGGVIATEDEGLRSGRGSASPGVAAGFRSGLGTAPVSTVASEAIDGEDSGAAGNVLCRVLCGGGRGRRR